ncbi:glycosyltransferase [Photobacterium iliopiscarium]|uniref:Glycosyl transferase family 1 domain-containing protein n=1 Tax=Photobacterium iliopiscarium TaxID=56192 RepID=A0A2T3MNU8_9GAMM|nr:glycosyltransferase [Photobacterium iliopiscarium]PSV98601.1 hypothetical protein C9I88_04005 [Photobacterium iliopiscarium]
MKLYSRIFIKLKQEAKKNKKIKKLYEKLFQSPVINYFNRSNGKRVLIAYSTYHFKTKKYTYHSNYQESIAIAEVFDQLGFIVDIVNNDEFTSLNLNNYDCVFGEGLPLYQASQIQEINTIYYGTGSYPWHCTFNSILRLKNFHDKYGGVYTSSGRLQDQRWSIAATLSDSVICIGNNNTKNTFINNGCCIVKNIRPTFHRRNDDLELLNSKNISKSKRNILWFGSYGLIHKGLDLAIEAIRNKPDWTLHVCGKLSEEQNIIDQIKLPENVVLHGFVDILGDKFKNLISDCLFVTLPSVSEGLATAVITCMGNGGLIPIITKNCGIDFSPFTIEADVDSILDMINKIEKIDDSELRELSIESYKFTINGFSIINFKENMKNILVEYLK